MSGLEIPRHADGQASLARRARQIVMSGYVKIPADRERRDLMPPPNPRPSLFRMQQEAMRRDLEGMTRLQQQAAERGARLACKQMETLR